MDDQVTNGLPNITLADLLKEAELQFETGTQRAELTKALTNALQLPISQISEDPNQRSSCLFLVQRCVEDAGIT